MNKPTLITLSFSTINNCLQPSNSHNWLNKQMGVKTPDYGYFQEGKDCHRIIQDHVSDTVPHELLNHIPIKFDIVERFDRDPATHFIFQINEKYAVHGYYDGTDKEVTRFLEIKSSGTPWSLGQFQKSMQRKIYVLSNKKIEESWLITCKRDPKLWKLYQPKYFKIPATEQDRKDALRFIMDAVQIIESGSFDGGLNEDGKCTDQRCYYGTNCQFK
jgi:hypothetical protein